MADNVELDSGSGGAQVRTKDRGGIETPVSLIDIGGSTGASTEQIIGDANVFMPVQGAVATGVAAAGNPVLVVDPAIFAPTICAVTPVSSS